MGMRARGIEKMFGGKLDFKNGGEEEIQVVRTNIHSTEIFNVFIIKRRVF